MEGPRLVRPRVMIPDASSSPPPPPHQEKEEEAVSGARGNKGGRSRIVSSDGLEFSVFFWSIRHVCQTLHRLPAWEPPVHQPQPHATHPRSCCVPRDPTLHPGENIWSTNLST